MGVPASNLAGSGAQVDRCSETVAIMSPPPWYGGMLLQKGLPAIQHTDPGRPENLVPREDEEVAVQVLHIHREVRRGLGTINQDRNAMRVSQCDQPLDWVDRTEGIGEVNQRDQPGSISQ